MDQETSDFILGAAILIPFLIAVFAAGVLLNRFKNRRFHAAWRPLVPVIDGTVVDDSGGGAASSWLTGTFQGRRVHAKMAPNLNRSIEGGLKYNRFEVAVDDVPGGSDWQVQYYTSFAGVGREGWHLEATDASVRERLERSGVLETVKARAGGVVTALPTVDYRKRESTLVYIEDAGPAWTPSPDRFRDQLALMMELVRLNAEANPAGAANRNS
jgi:hypothetical protein